MNEQRRRRTAEARGRKTPQAVGGEHKHCGVWVGRVLSPKRQTDILPEGKHGLAHPLGE